MNFVYIFKRFVLLAIQDEDIFASSRRVYTETINLTQMQTQIIMESRYLLTHMKRGGGGGWGKNKQNLENSVEISDSYCLLP